MTGRSIVLKEPHPNSFAREVIMNANCFIVTVLTLFLFGIQGCTKSTATVTEQLSGAEYEKRRLQIIEFFSKRQTRYEVVATTETKSGLVWPDYRLDKTRTSGARWQNSNSPS